MRPRIDEPAGSANDDNNNNNDDVFSFAMSLMVPPKENAQSASSSSSSSDHSGNLSLADGRIQESANDIDNNVKNDNNKDNYNDDINDDGNPFLDKMRLDESAEARTKTPQEVALNENVAYSNALNNVDYEMIPQVCKQLRQQRKPRQQRLTVAAMK